MAEFRERRGAVREVAGLVWVYGSGPFVAGLVYALYCVLPIAFLVWLLYG